MIVVEVRDAEGVTTSRLKVHEGVATIGRGPDNAVVVDDEYVDALHLQVTVRPDGSVTVRDVGTTNGTRLAGTRLGDEAVVVPLGTPVAIGRSTVVFHSSGAPVGAAKQLPEEPAAAPTHAASPATSPPLAGPSAAAPTLAATPATASTDAVERPDLLFRYDRIPLGPVLFVAIVESASVTWGSSYAFGGAAGLVGVAIGVGALLLLWAGVWAVGTRLFSGAFRYRQHLAFASAVVAVLVPLQTLMGAVVYAVGDPTLEFLSDWILFGVVSWPVVCFGHVDIASRGRRALKVSVAGGLAAAALALAVWGTVYDPSPVMQIEASLRSVLPLPTSLTRSRSLEDFMTGLDGLEAKVESDARESDPPAR